MFKKKTKKIYLCEHCPTTRSNEAGKCSVCGTDLKGYAQAKPFFVFQWFNAIKNLFRGGQEINKQPLLWRRIAIALIILFIINNISIGLALKIIPNKNIGGLQISESENPELKQAASYLKFKKIKASFIPSGVPDVYGPELNISFDAVAVQDAINKTAILDPTYGQEGKKIALTDFTPAELERYKKIGFSIACEYCCGATTLVFENGEAACGCDHSQMMRGLAAYLIKNHPQEFTDEQILEELKKWKITYFPKQTLSAELDRLAKTGEQGIKEILEEFPDFLPEMIGGC